MQMSTQRSIFWIYRILLLSLLLALCTLDGAANGKKLGPQEAVTDFCRFDLSGVRLDSTNPHQSEFAALIHGEGDWPEEPVEIVRDFRVVSVHGAQTVATVAVEFEVRGSLRGALETDQLSIRQDTETVEFPLLRVHGSWKIKPFDLPPHVSIQTIQRHVRDIMESDEKNGQGRRHEMLERLLAKLQSLDG
jgi:hypothetical protein